eukprot:gene15627-1721_t
MFGDAASAADEAAAKLAAVRAELDAVKRRRVETPAGAAQGVIDSAVAASLRPYGCC